jgi:hypothetical protein
MSNQAIYHLEKSGEVSEKYKINTVIAGRVSDYFNLNFSGTKVTIPYYINTKRKKDLRVLVGKGTPEEIKLETKVWAQVKGESLKEMEESEIRELMLNVGIGIDCSGFVTHILNPYFQEKFGKPFYRLINYREGGIRKRLARWLRPVENLGADEMTSELNTKEIKVNDVRPGDLIRGIGKQRNAFHVALITEVITDKLGNNQEITYVHSHRQYGKENGVRRGKVKVTDPEKDFLEQNWTEIHEDGRNYLYEDIAYKPKDSGFRRLKLLSK